MEGIEQSTVETIYVNINQLDEVQRWRVIPMTGLLGMIPRPSLPLSSSNPTPSISFVTAHDESPIQTFSSVVFFKPYSFSLLYHCP